MKRQTKEEMEGIRKELSERNPETWTAIRDEWADLLHSRLKNVNRKDFQSPAGLLLYLDDPTEGIVAISFNQPVWAYKSVQRQNGWQKHYESEPDNVLDLIIHEDAKSQPDLFSQAAYTGGAIGIFGQISQLKRRADRCDFEIEPFEYLFGARGVADIVNREYDSNRNKGLPSRLIGCGCSDIAWKIIVPSEIVADYQVIGSVNQLRDIFEGREK